MASESLVGSLPPDWKQTTLGEACDRGGGNIQTGPFGSQLHASDYVSDGIPSIMAQNIGNNRVLEEGIARITADDAERLSRYLVQTGDIVYSRRGDVEKRALVREEEDGWLCGTGCLRVRFGAQGEDSAYASYYLGHPGVRAWIVRHAQGATMPNLNTSILSSLPFVVPPIGEQRAIASILGTLDDKIELNRQMNETLEAMARAIFKSWFADFDPIRAKAEGRDPSLPKHIADLFPDRFEDSELGEIPAGWKTSTLGEIAENPRRTIRPAQIEETTTYIGLEHMPRQSISLADWDSSEGLESNKYDFKRGEILFGKLRPYFHKVGIAPVDGICSTDILVVAAKQPEWYAFLLEHVSSEDFVNYTTATSSGTKMPRTNWKDMSSFDIVTPPSSLAKAFDVVLQPFMKRIVENIHESRTLAALRDALLPRLISGELRVGEAEAFVRGTVGESREALAER
ncbi:MAG: restriction endonuclease subunit S [Actinobacteria bacterium]|nr:restriction endonuclease subunit S [Actinomycetota bacterium]